MIYFFQTALAKEVEHAIKDRLENRCLSPDEMHNQIRNLYSWHDVASRTHAVYDKVMLTPVPDTAQRLDKYVWFDRDKAFYWNIAMHAMV